MVVNGWVSVTSLPLFQVGSSSSLVVIRRVGRVVLTRSPVRRCDLEGLSSSDEVEEKLGSLSSENCLVLPSLASSVLSQSAAKVSS